MSACGEGFLSVVAGMRSDMAIFDLRFLIYDLEKRAESAARRFWAIWT